jgi:hypothetical protein
MLPVVPWQSRPCTFGSAGIGAGWVLVVVSLAVCAAVADGAVNTGPAISVATARAVASLRIEISLRHYERFA